MMNVDEMREHEWSVSWSGGKDSTATIILMHENNIPIKDITYVRMMWDDNLPATLPEMTSFVDETKKKFEEWGYKVNIVKSEHTAKSYTDKVFYKSKNPEKNGSKYGICAFMRRACKFQREKPNTIKKLRQSEYEMIGYASDEVERLERLTDTRQSIMAVLGVKEADTFEICRKFSMLSPLYEMGFERDGCWFCPNASVRERNFLRIHHPELVELINQSINQCSFDLTNLSSMNNWLRDKYMCKEYAQMTIYDYLKLNE